MLYEELEEEDLFIINYDTKSRMGEGEQRDSNINLVFASVSICVKIEYEQLKDSDHSSR